MSEKRGVSLRGCRQNNLTGFDLELPLRTLIAFTGSSGSGRRSLVFGTVHAESRRRYLESFSTAARGELESFARPDLDAAEGLPLTVAIRADSLAAGPRQTVATATGALPLLAGVFCRHAQPHCAACRRDVRSWTPQDVVDEIRQLPAGTRLQVGFLLRESLPLGEAARWLVRGGFSRGVVDERVISLETLTADTRSLPTEGLFVIVDRIASDTGDDSRWRESLEVCFRGGRDTCRIIAERPLLDDSPAATLTLDGRDWFRSDFSRILRCAGCGREFPEPVPQLFSFSSALGACRECRGTGSIRTARGAATETCPVCGGDRWNDDARAFRWRGRSLPELLSLTLDEFSAWFSDVSAGSASRGLCETLASRLAPLRQAGLGVLRLDAPIASLSDGERRRLALCHALAAPLTGALYLVETPSSGVVDTELDALAEQLAQLRERGNSVWIIDDHPGLLAGCERVIRLGPGAGTHGGQIVFDGLPAEYARRFPAGPTESARTKSHSGAQIVWKRPGAEGETSETHTIGSPSLTIFTGPSASRPIEVFRAAVVPEMSLDPRFEQVIAPRRHMATGSVRNVVAAALHVFPAIRRAFAETPEARRRQATAAAFSLHATDGLRCSVCEGTGRIAIDMRHLSDLESVCHECRGTRYRAEVDEFRLRGVSIVEALRMTADDAFRFFKGDPGIQRKLQRLREWNLHYLRLEQPLSELSPGELCRLRLAAETGRVSVARRLFLLEEPTAGLSREEVPLLLEAFRRLIDAGATVLCADTHPLLIAGADAVIDLR